MFHIGAKMFCNVELRAALEARAWILLLFETCICVINSHDICVDSVRLTSWCLILKASKTLSNETFICNLRLSSTNCILCESSC